MESVLMNKFEIVDMSGMNTLAFVVEENVSEVVMGETYYSLQKLDHTDKEMDGKIKFPKENLFRKEKLFSCPSHSASNNQFSNRYQSCKEFFQSSGRPNGFSES